MTMDWEAEYRKLAQRFVEVQGEMHGQMSRLQRENDALRKQIAEMPSTLTDLQDRVSMLQDRQ
jgi:uncharacterized coiled-coil DUF342 family protein